MRRARRVVLWKIAALETLLLLLVISYMLVVAWLLRIVWEEFGRFATP